MSKQRRSAYGAPHEQKEVAITVDRRLFYGLGLIVVFGAALAGGMWFAGRGDVQAANPPGPVADIGAPTGPLITQSQAELEAQMAAIGINPQLGVVITPNAPIPDDENPFKTPLAQVTPAAGGAPSGPISPPPMNVPGFGDVSEGGEDVTRLLPAEGDRHAANWEPEVLAEFADANLSAEFQPLRAEVVSEPQSGPRIAISDLNEQHTYNFGVVPMRDLAEHDFYAKNVGDQDLIISRVYAGCGCTATVFDGRPIKADGFLEQPAVLKPGESASFTVQFDPRAEGKAMTQAKYIQIYSNDPHGEVYEPTDPLSHEIRFRIVVKPQ